MPGGRPILTKEKALARFPFVAIAVVTLITAGADLFMLRQPATLYTKIPLLLFSFFALMGFRGYWFPAVVGSFFVLGDFIRREDFQLTFVAFPAWILACFFAIDEIISRFRKEPEV